MRYSCCASDAIESEADGWMRLKSMQARRVGPEVVWSSGLFSDVMEKLRGKLADEGASDANHSSRGAYVTPETTGKRHTQKPLKAFVPC